MRLRHKLLAIVMSATAAALLLAGAVLFAWDVQRLRDELLGDLRATAALIADHSTAALAFQDPSTAHDNLASLRSQAVVVAACLYDDDGALFARYQSRSAADPECPPAPEPPGSRVGERRGHLWAPVAQQGTQLGTLYLRSDLGPLRQRQRLQLWTLAGVLAMALLGALLLSLRLQRFVPGPVGELAAVAEAVTRRRDYSLRAQRRSRDEVGELVTAFNQMLAEIEASDVDLRHEVEERQRAEQEKAALLGAEQEARREAEAANRLKDEFLATLSHELRTPLNAILGWVALVQAGKNDAETLERAMTVIERNARAQAQLVDDLLDVSRIITGKLSLDLRPVDLPATLREVADAIRPAAEAKGIAVEVEVGEGIPRFRADPARLQQMIWNLVSNAVKFTPGEGRVWIRARSRQGRVEIEVEDRGIGIAEEFLPHVFERFRQQDSSTTRAHGGLGLGLAIVRHLVELHGGEVEAESPGQGQGALFRIRLPLRPAPEEGEAAPAAEARGDLRGLRVLLVEDEPDARELYRVILEENGARVVDVASAREALTSFEVAPPDVLVSDVGLEGMDGYELITRIRRLPAARGGSVPAVALTAYAGKEHARRAFASGFQMHVSKPVAAGELVALVRELAASSAGGREAARP
ncbi:MAG TPA: ATP-binding protein [Thermoanaerobaculia bacterium]|nr:ATP-binding protein [Thermoanaerobaculia bacterium]